MARKKKAGEWSAFLRELRKSGNVRVAAFAAGMDPGTAYDERARDPAFAARMEKARAAGKANAAKARPPSRKAAADKGGELVARRSKRHGTQFVRAAPGRWSDEVWAAFRAELRLTGNVRAAARACGLSTRALYERRRNYPAVAAAWEEDLALAKERIPALLTAATIAALDPEIEDDELPKVNVDQAIAIARLKCGGGGGPGRRGRWIVKEPSIEEVRDEVLRRIAAIRRHREKSLPAGTERAVESTPPPTPPHQGEGGEDREDL